MANTVDEFAKELLSIIAEELERRASEAKECADVELMKAADGTGWWDMYVATHAKSVTYKEAADAVRDLGKGVSP